MLVKFNKHIYIFSVYIYYKILLKTTLQGESSEYVNSDCVVPKKKSVKYPFKVIQSLQNKFNYDDGRRTNGKSLETINHSGGTKPNDGNSKLTYK